jgi:hypothetical protein
MVWKTEFSSPVKRGVDSRGNDSRGVDSRRVQSRVADAKGCGSRGSHSRLPRELNEIVMEVAQRGS